MCKKLMEEIDFVVIVKSEKLYEVVVVPKNLRFEDE